MTLAFFLTHWFQYFYAPAQGPWYAGNVWGNVFVIAVVAPLGWLWSRTRYWPLRPLKRVLEHVRHHTQLVEELHHLAHVGEEHPRVRARRAAGEHPTPKRPA